LPIALHGCCLIVCIDEGQQRQVTRTLNFACQFALAARTVACLTAWTNFARFADEFLQGVDVFIIEAASFRAVIGTRTSATSPPPALIAVIAVTVIAAIITASTATEIPAATSSATTSGTVVSVEIHVFTDLT
jgi:hypothetical protein